MAEPPRPKPTVLVVIDGWGVAPPWGGNAISLASTPFFNEAQKTFPRTTLQAAGEAVGLPMHERGNSEVGHLNIGSGQVVHQALPAISATIQDGSFYTNEVLVKAMTSAQQAGRAVHLLGLVSDGGVHSHIDHLYGLIDMAKKIGVQDLAIHAICDGRDSPPFIAQEYLSHVNSKLREVNLGRICTVAGRYYTMDRDHHWDRIELSYRAMTEGVGPVAKTAEAAVAAAYREGFSDEFIKPTIIQGEQNSFRAIEDGDTLIFFNFRADRAREISQAFAAPDFSAFDRKKTIKNLHFVSFTYYQEGLPIEVAFRPKDVNFPLARILSEAKLKQLHVAESEKYAHVTYFFNGGREEPFTDEDRIVIPSPHVGSYDQDPGMATQKITDTILDNLKKYDFIVANFACPDMVGHTGNLRSTVEACEIVDKSLSRIYKAILPLGGLLIVTADHGNAEEMVNPKTGEPDTEHTANPVPFLLVGEAVLGQQLRMAGSLSDVAPTILDLMQLPKPAEMTGVSLLIKNQNPPVTPVNPAIVPVTQSAK